MHVVYGGVTASVAYEAQVLRYCNVAAVAFLAYDMLLHLGDEVRLIWKSNNTWVKWVYLYLRHYGLLIIALLLIHGNSSIPFTPRSCLNWFIAETVFSNSVIIVTEVMLFIRVYAVYAKSKIVLCALGAASMAEMITVIITTIKAFQTARVSLDLGCVLVYVPPILTYAWVASLGFQTLIFGLTIAKYLTQLMVTKQLGRRSIMYVFMRDGGWAYGVMFVVFMVNLLTFRLKTSPLATVVFRWAMVMASFTGSHLLLNLRRLGASLQEDFTSPSSIWEYTNAGQIIFAERGGDDTAGGGDPMATYPAYIELEPAASTPTETFRERLEDSASIC